MVNYFYFKIKKCLKIGLSSSAGKNFLGRICVKGKGGGNKRIYRKIDFIRRINCYGILIRKIYDRNRSSFIAWLFMKMGWVII